MKTLYKIVIITFLVFLSSCNNFDRDEFKESFSIYETFIIEEYDVYSNFIMFDYEDNSYIIMNDKYFNEAIDNHNWIGSRLFFCTEDMLVGEEDAISIQGESKEYRLIENVTVFFEGYNPLLYGNDADINYDKMSNSYVINSFKKYKDGILLNHNGYDYYFEISSELWDNYYEAPDFISIEKNTFIIEINSNQEVIAYDEINDYYIISNAYVEIDKNHPFTHYNFETYHTLNGEQIIVVHNGYNYLVELSDEYIEKYASGQYGITVEVDQNSKVYTDNILHVATIDGKEIEYYNLYDFDFVKLVPIE